MQRSAVLAAGAVWFALAGLLGMHVVVSATANMGAAVAAGHSAGTPAAHVAAPAAESSAGTPGRSGVVAAVHRAANADGLAGALRGGGGMAHAALACLVSLLVVVTLRRHRASAWLRSRAPAHAPVRDLALDSSRLSAALRWRTDPVRQAVLLT